jgi:hypothetical protein
MHVLERELSYEEVAEIFVRVNSLGVKLRGSDLALAQITARWRNSLKLLEEFQEECEEKWFTLDLGHLVRGMVVFATGQSQFRSVGNIPLERLQDGWEQAKEGLRFAINFLRSNAGIDDESLLSSHFLAIVIAYFSQLRKGKLSKQEERDLLYWLYLANARGRYSRGATETILDADLATLRKGAPADLIDSLKQQFGRLDLQPSDFAGRGSQSALFALVFLALKRKGAKDWESGLNISLTHQGRLHYIQYHHIFPKAKLKGLYETSEINEIANMAFISGHTNRRLGTKSPADYFPAIIEKRGPDALECQCVPLDADLHRIDNYRRFLEVRREALADVVNQFIQAAREG